MAGYFQPQMSSESSSSLPASVTQRLPLGAVSFSGLRRGGERSSVLSSSSSSSVRPAPTSILDQNGLIQAPYKQFNVEFLSLLKVTWVWPTAQDGVAACSESAVPQMNAGFAWLQNAAKKRGALFNLVDPPTKPEQRLYYEAWRHLVGAVSNHTLPAFLVVAFETSRDLHHATTLALMKSDGNHKRLTNMVLSDAQFYDSKAKAKTPMAQITKDAQGVVTELTKIRTNLLKKVGAWRDAAVYLGAYATWLQERVEGKLRADMSDGMREFMRLSGIKADRLVDMAEKEKHADQIRQDNPHISDKVFELDMSNWVASQKALKLQAASIKITPRDKDQVRAVNAELEKSISACPKLSFFASYTGMWEPNVLDPITLQPIEPAAGGFDQAPPEEKQADE